LEAPETITLDLNKLAEGQVFIGLDAYEVSDNGRLLAHSIDSTGFREYLLRVKDLETGRLLPDRIEKVASVAWAADDRTLFYTTIDEAKRPYRLYRHTLGESEDELIYEEADERFALYVGRTRSQRYLLLLAGSHTTTEYRYLPADQPRGAWMLLSARHPGREYYVEHHGPLFYLRVNDTGRNFRLVSVSVDDTRAENWVEIIPHSNDVMLEGVDFFAHHYALYERRDGLPQITVTDLRSGISQRVEFPEAAYDVRPSQNYEWNTQKLRYRYQSQVTPPSIYDFDMKTGSSTLLKRRPVLGYDPKNYRSERYYATAADGARIPISLVYRPDVVPRRPAPLYMNGYGSYGWPYPVEFTSSQVSLLDRGVIVAIAHIRGGGEMGKRWHDQGRMMSKMNTFTDFIAAAEYLIDQGITTSNRLAIEGWSAGGLLTGAVSNMRPDLFKAVILHFPFVDVLNTMLDDSLPLTVGEYEEWGNPNIAEEYRYMKRYCPYTNIQAQDYPATLVRTSINDSQVMYWEPVKYVAKRRRLKTDDNPLLLVINMGAGHDGASGRYDYLRETAGDFAFVLWQLGVAE